MKLLLREEISNSFLYLSKIYDKLGQIEEAYDSARQSAINDVKNKDAFIQYGKMALKIGDKNKALTCFKKVLTLDSTNEEAIELINKLT